MEGLLFYIVGLILLIVLGKILTFPLRRILELVANAVLGGFMLVIVNYFGSFLGINILISPLNAILVGFLGVPGVVILLLFQLL